MQKNKSQSIELLNDMGLRLRKIRIAHEITQEELAERAGVSRKVIGRMERGDGSVTLEKWMKVSQILGVSDTWKHVFEVMEDPFEQYDRRQQEEDNFWKKRVRSRK